MQAFFYGQLGLVAICYRSFFI